MEIIKQKQPKKAAGFQPIKPFAHKGKHRRDAYTDQGLVLSAWSGDVSTRVDVDRVNWPGILFLQAECGLFDSKPRLVRKGV